MRKKQFHVMITGAGGFIGGNLSNYLSSKYKIVAYYNSRLGVKLKKKIKIKKKNLKKIKRIDKNIKVLIHCASVVPPGNKQANCFKTNTLMDAALIKAVKNSQIKKIIFLSSVSVYGIKKNRVIYEDSSFSKPDLYGLSKRIGELNFEKISNKKNIKVIVLRLSTVVGKNCHSTFLSRLSENIKTMNKINIYNPKSYYNSCIHISNLNIIIHKLIKFNQKIKFDVINIYSKHPVRLKSIFNLFKQKLNKRVKFNQISSKKKSYIIKSLNAERYNLKFSSTKSNLQKFISDL